MIHLIWSGRGYLVAAITFGISLAANLLTDAVTDGEAYWEDHRWPFAISLFVSALACSYASLIFRERRVRRLVDSSTRRPVRRSWWGRGIASFSSR
jgi:hypothetical protein